jgi:small subunit ribosomal protein S2
MASVTLKELLEAGAHFGHQTQRWNPKMKRFILCPRNGIHIIDLNKTISQLDKFVAKVKSVASKGGKVLFVGTKKQVKTYIKEEAERCGMPYITERWLGGMLTNLKTIKESIKKLDKIEKMEADGTIEDLPKKEVILLSRQKEKLLSNLGGIRDLKKAPELVFVVDTLREHLAVAEANRLRIPVAAIADTNSNPDELAYPIPANDDAIKSVKVITEKISNAIIEVTKDLKAKKAKEAAEKAENAPAQKETKKKDPAKRVVKNKTSDKPADAAPAAKRVVKKKTTEEV